MNDTEKLFRCFVRSTLGLVILLPALVLGADLSTVTLESLLGRSLSCWPTHPEYQSATE